MVLNSVTSSESFSRVAPFAIFMAFIALEEGLRFIASKTGVEIPYTFFLYLYPVKSVVVGGTLIYFRKSYTELRWKDLHILSHTLLSITIGLIVFLLWIRMTWPWAIFGTMSGFNPTGVSENITRNILTIFRVFGAAVIVPIMEELFWRSWLLRYIISPNFQSIEPGKFTIISFIIGTILFGLEHNLWVAGIMAGAFYSMLLYRTKSIAQCIVAHAVTNFVLAVFIIQTGRWEFF